MNDTLQTIYHHKSIRCFKDQPLSVEQHQAILKAAQHTPTYTFLQAATIIGITDKDKKQALADVCKQNYVATAPTLFVVVADLARHVAIAQAKGQTDLSVLDSADRFFATFYDATLMTMNMVTAAESLGLGAVILGSINNDMQATIDLLDLPKYTFPCLGLAVGYPNQAPALKPRLPQELVYMENSYQPAADVLAQLADYDEVVHAYYDLRDTSKTVDRYTDQMVAALAPTLPAKRADILKVLRQQGFLNG